MASDLSHFDDSLLIDVTIKFSGQEIEAHKAVLANRSKNLRTAFDSDFWETYSREINLGDNEDAAAMRAMIRHLYYLPYDQMIDEK